MKTIEEQMQDLYWYITDPRMDGFSQFEKKKKLYKIKWLADELLEKCNFKFIGEEEFIKENRKVNELTKG